MKVIGKTRPGATQFEIVANTKRVARYLWLLPARAVKLSVYVDGLGSGNGDQVMRGVIYDASGSLVAMGDEVLVHDGQAAGWIDLTFAAFPFGVKLTGGAQYDFGVIGGVATNSIRVYGDDPGSGALTSALPLTVSGNEITDVTRALGQAGDGRGYVQVTNLVTNGGFETNTTLWGGYANGFLPVPTMTLDASKAKFGTKSVRIDTAAANANEGIISSPVAVAGLMAYTASAWVWAAAGQSIQLGMDWKVSGVFISSTNAVATGTGDWQQVAVTGTSPVNANGVTITLYARNPGGPVATTIWADGVQLEIGSVAHAYVETNGAIATQTQGAPDSSYGMWEATTNLLSNSDFETNASGWSYAGNPTTLGDVARDTSTSKFRGASLRAFGIQSQNFTPTNTPISDATRAANVEGDGRSYQYVYNACPNGGFETNITGWVLFQGATITQDAAHAQFGTKALKIVTPGVTVAGGGEGVTGPATGVGTAAQGQTWTGSCWVFSVAGGEQVGFVVEERTSTNTFLTASTFVFTLNPGWNRLTGTRTLTNASVSQVGIDLRTATTAQAITVWMDGVQLEVGAVAHDFVNTSTVAAGAIQGPLVTNLVPNGSAEFGTSYAFPRTGSTTLVRDTIYSKFGSASFKLSTAAESSDGYNFWHADPSSFTEGGVGKGIPVVGGQTYTFSCYVKIPTALGGGSGGAKAVRLRIVEWNDAGALVRDDNSASNVLVSIGNVFDWTRITYTVTLLSTATNVSLRVNTNFTIGDVWVDGVQFERALSPSTYVDTTGAPAASSVGIADGSQGFWETATNLCPNGGVETGIANVSTSGANQPSGISVALGAGVGLTGTFTYRVSTYITNVNGTFESVAAVAGTLTPANQDVIVNLGTLGNSDATGRKIYRTSDGGTTWKLVATVAGSGVGTTFDDTTPDAGLSTVSLPTAAAAGVSRVLTAARFGAASLQVKTPGGVAAEGAFFSTATGLARAAGTAFIGSGWIIGAPGVVIDVWLRVNNTDVTSSDSAHSTYTMTGDWMRVTSPSFTVQAGKTADGYTVMFRTKNTGTLTVFHLDGVQIEERTFATPYIHTNGATATRTGSNFTHAFATNFVTAGQGWAGAWMRMGVPSASMAAGSFYNVFNWFVDGTSVNRITGYYAQSTGKFHIESDATGGNASTSVTLAFAPGDYVYVEFAWTATTVLVSVNGAAFVSAARPAAPTGASNTLNIAGTTATTSVINSDLLWLGTGKGTRSNADTLATYNSLLVGVEPANTTFAAGNTLTALAPMATTAYIDWANAWPFIRTNPGFAATAGTTYTFSAWVLAPAGQAMTLRLMRADFVTPLGTTVFVGTGAWQRVQVTGAAVATETIFGFVISSASFIGGSFWIDGAQLEAKAVATPFTPGSRSAARVQVPSLLIDKTQGWVAVRCRIGWGNAFEPNGGTGFPRIFDWDFGANGYITVTYQEASDQFFVQRYDGTTFVVAAKPQAVSIGDTVTVVAAWTANSVSISINGSAFVTVAGTSIPASGEATLFDIGRRTAGADSYIDADVLWATGGVGALTDANAATLNAFGNTDPTFAAVPGSPSFIWTADNATYITTDTGGRNIDTYSDGASNPRGAMTPLDYDLSIFATYVNDWTPPDQDEPQFARLPFAKAQAALDGAAIPLERFQVTAGWFGTRRSPERGAFVIVDSEGPLAGLVGERLRVSRADLPTPRSVVAYCHTRDNVEFDLSLSRRAYLALGELNLDSLDVLVEVIS